MSYAEDLLARSIGYRQREQRQGRDQGTLIQRLGFQDPDRGDLHDRICQHLCSASSIALLVAAGADEDEVRVSSVRLEVPIQKGTGQYATTVGFADVVIDSEWLTPGTDVWTPERYLVEVKTKIASVGDLLRQVNLYREYTQEECAGYIVYSYCDNDTRFAKMLLSQDIVLVTYQQVLPVIEAWRHHARYRG